MGNYAAATRATSPQLEPTSFFPQQPLAKICEGGPFWARGTANLTSPANPIATLHQGSSTLPCAFKVLFNSARLLALRCVVGLAALLAGCWQASAKQRPTTHHPPLQRLPTALLLRHR
jgi:hypothetical protein